MAGSIFIKYPRNVQVKERCNSVMTLAKWFTMLVVVRRRRSSLLFVVVRRCRSSFVVVVVVRCCSSSPFVVVVVVRRRSSSSFVVVCHLCSLPSLFNVVRRRCSPSLSVAVVVGTASCESVLWLCMNGVELSAWNPDAHPWHVRCRWVGRDIRVGERGKWQSPYEKSTTPSGKISFR